MASDRAELDVARAYTDPLALLDDPGVDAAVIATPTHAPRARDRRRRAEEATFCEKPPALSLDEVTAMKTAIERSGISWNVAFWRV